MSQLNTAIVATSMAPVAAPVAKPATEAPDVMFVVRHYMWLIVVGTVLGIGVGTGLFFFFKQYSPTFVAERRFQVLPPQLPPFYNAGGGPVSVTSDSDELSRFMARQGITITSNEELDTVLQIQEVRNTNWFKEANVGDPKVQLRKDLKVIPEPRSETLRITMSGKVPTDISTIVNAVADEYVRQLTTADAKTTSADRKLVDEAVQKMQAQVDTQIDDMKTFRNNHKVDAITNTYNIALSALGELQRATTDAQEYVNGAKANKDSIERQAAQGTLELTPELELYVENDPNLRAIESMRLNLDIDRAVQIIKYDKNHPAIQDIDARLAAINIQGNDIREKLRSAARLRMQESAAAAFEQAQAHYDSISKQKTEKEASLADMDRNLVEYRQKEESLSQLQHTLEDLQRQKRMGELSSGADLSRVRTFGDSAHPPGPDDMSFPRFWIFSVGGLLTGMLGSFVVAYLLERTNTRVRTPRDITRSMELPLLGFIPDQQDDNFSEGALALSVRTSPGSVIAESFRQIRGRLAAQFNGKPLHTLLVASMSPGGGATTVASNIANGMALNDVRVLLIDANFYRPGLSHSYKNLPTSGLGELISGRARLEDIVVASEDLSTLHLMGPGMMPAVKVSELMESRAFRDVVLPLLKSKYDLVIFDGAPMNLVSDSIALGAKVDGVIAVVRAGAISKGMVARVRDQLKQVQANLVGLVLNAAQIQSAGYFRENYRTFYKYAGPSSQRRSDAVPTADSAE